MKKDEVVVYWAPSVTHSWNVLYSPPENVYLDLISNINKESPKNSFFACPSFKDLMMNTFLIRNPIESNFSIDDNFQLTQNSKNYVESRIIHEPSISNNILFEYGISHFFFCEEDLNAFKFPPFFHNPSHHKYGSVVPGKWNCSAWIRPIINEINLWEGVKEISILENEPLAYYYFDTNKKVVLKRFVPNEKIMDISRTCIQSRFWEKGASLSKRYKRFKTSETNKIILKEIKKNLVDNE